jgi:ABC-2 type transport system permease protein
MRLILQFWQTFTGVFYKEILILRRDRAYVWTIIGLQLVDVLAMGFIDATIRDMPLVVVDQDHTADSRQLAQRLEATRTFKIRFSTSSTEQARSHLRAGRAHAAVVIPPGFGRSRSLGERADVLTLVDGSDSTRSNQAIATVDALAAELSVHNAEERVPRVDVHIFPLFNPSGKTSLFMLPGLLALALSRGFGVAASSIAYERESGNMERVRMCPLSETGLVCGVMAPHIVMACLNGVIYLVLMRFAFDVPIRGSLLLLSATLVLYSFTLVALGAFISTVAKTSADAMTATSALGVLSILLTGYILPLSSLPKPLFAVAHALPETHFIIVMRALCLRGSSVFDLRGQLAYLVIAPIVLTWLAGLALRREGVD